MKLKPLYTALLLACCSITLCSAQTAAPQVAQPAASKPYKRQPPKPAAEQAPGAAPDKVWVNLSTKIYHCPGDRYYGRTKDGSYMAEAQAKAAGAHGVRNQTCFK